MKIKFYKLDELDKNLKVTIHKTGKMGFTVDSAKKLNLLANKSADIGVNEDDKTDDSLYLAVYHDANGQFRVSKAGDYFYINTKVLFDNLKMDYSNGDIVYDMSEVNIDGVALYKLKRRKKDDKQPE